MSCVSPFGHEVVHAGVMEPVHLLGGGDAAPVGFFDIGACSHGDVG